MQPSKPGTTGSSCSVFLDDNPRASAAHRWKMVCGAPGAVYASPDGLSWTALPFAPTSPDDTMPTAAWDPRLDKYLSAKCLP